MHLTGEWTSRSCRAGWNVPMWAGDISVLGVPRCWGWRQLNTCCLSALAAAGPTQLLSPKLWRNPKNALHTLGHALQRSEKINSRNISKSGFIFFPYSGPDFTFPRVSNHYFLLLPLVFHLFSFLTLAQELQYVICLSGGTKIVLLYRLVLQHRMSLACQGCKHRVNPAFHGLHFPCTCLFHILCLPQDGSNCLTFDSKVRGMTHLEAKM